MLRYNGTIWEYLNTGYAGVPSRITGPAGTPVEDGHGLTYVWKYRNRLFFIQGGSMNAWYLPVNAIGGALIRDPAVGRGEEGRLAAVRRELVGVDAGDGIDDKCCFFTDQGEVLVFTGTDPTSRRTGGRRAATTSAQPLGKNAHQQLGGDVLVATVDGIVPLSAAVQKDLSALSLSAITCNIEPMWMREFRTKDVFPWTLAKWDEGDALFVTFPGGKKHGHQDGRRQQPAHRRVDALRRLGRDVLHANARRYVLRHPGRQDHAGRQHRLRRCALGCDNGREHRQRLRLQDGRRLGDVSGAAQSGDVAAGARDVLHVGARAVRAADRRHHRLRVQDPAAAERRAGSRPARRLGPGAVGADPDLASAEPGR